MARAKEEDEWQIVQAVPAMLIDRRWPVLTCPSGGQHCSRSRNEGRSAYRRWGLFITVPVLPWPLEVG